jgi:KDO2-lipid IV(A) lauroyltransferase
LAYRVFRRERALALRHLELAFGEELSPRSRERIARACFANAGRLACEFALLDKIRARREELFALDGEDHLAAVLGRGTGCIAVTGHIGNWELLASYFAWRGIPVSAIARRVYVPKLNELVVSWRQRQGVQTIVRESPNAAREILRVLKNNGILAILVDQDTHVPSISVPFFGRMARTPVAAAALAVRRGLPVVPVFIQRTGPVGWKVIVRPPLESPAEMDRKQAVRELTVRINAAIEQQIRANPAEWPWWHRRWRRAPIAKLDLDAPLQYEGANAR